MPCKHLRRRLASLLASLSVALPAMAPCAPAPRLVVMCLAAHPDDEDGATLWYERTVRHAKTYSVFFTRGEGGQNETGPELYKALAAIRTQETRRASAIVGSEAVFLNFPDFGYSKTATETYTRWGGRDEVLRRLVYVIRTLRPDVLITNHHPWLDAGENHGNHQVVALAALEAMAAAADSTYHPEQFVTGIHPWQVHKLFMRVRDDSGYGEARAFSALPDLRIPVGAVVDDGRSAEAVAELALREHRSQGMGLHPTPPDPHAVIAYELLQADANYPTFVDTMDAGLVPDPARTIPDSAARVLDPSYFSLAYLDAGQPHMLPTPFVAVRGDLRVGVVQTYDDAIVRALRVLNLPYDVLDSATLAAGDLGHDSVIVIDIRAYAKRPDLVAHNGRLLDYVRRGGRAIVLYQKTTDWNPDYAPLPLTLTRDRVTEEDARVTLASPDDPLFTTPNEVDSGDWKGWAVERGLYFPAPAPGYTELLSMHDRGEAPLRTGILRVHDGAGTWWYCCLSLYRQLNLNHAGAFKLFANMLSY